MLPAVIRPAEPTDRHFILNSWKASLRDYNRHQRTDEYFTSMNKTCNDVLAGPALVLVACSPADPNVILGWIAMEDTARGLVCWMANVKSPYRRQKVAKRLLVAGLERLDSSSSDRFYAAHTRHDERVEALGFEFKSYAQCLHLRDSREASLAK